VAADKKIGSRGARKKISKAAGPITLETGNWQLKTDDWHLTTGLIFFNGFVKASWENFNS
jgi:hypothetical protein